MTYFRVTDPDAELIRAAREKAGLTQQQAAEKAGLPEYQRWSEYERGKKNIDEVRWQWFLLQVGLHPQLTIVRK
jgi:hypothetical protein